MLQQGRQATPLAQSGHGLWKLELVIQLGETDHVASATTAIAVEQVAVRIEQKTRLVIGMQGTQAHEAAAADAPRGLLILRL